MISDEARKRMSEGGKKGGKAKGLKGFAAIDKELHKKVSSKGGTQKWLNQNLKNSNSTLSTTEQ